MINSKSLGVYSGPHHSILTPALLLYLLFTVEVMGAQRHEINCPRSLGSFFFFFLFFLGPYPWHMKVPRLGVESELQLPAYYTTATATRDPSRVCDLYYSSQQCRILNPLSEVRDRTRILMEPRQVHLPLSHEGNSTHTPLFWPLPQHSEVPGLGIKCKFTSVTTPDP